jgi:hypothetical protein
LHARQLCELILAQALNPDISQIMHNLAGLLIPQEIFPQSGVITDTPFLLKFPCETNILRDLRADL